jgi:hypothetical protein
MKRTCSGCKALNMELKYTCKLGYDNYSNAYIQRSWMPKPQVECPKPLTNAISKINHHYASNESARSSLLTWINQGIVKGVKLDKSKRPYGLHLTKEGLEKICKK